MAKTESKPRPKQAAAKAPRARKLTRKQAKAKAKKEVAQRKALPGSFKLTRRVLGIFKRNWKTLGGIVVVYLLLNILFASGISNISGSFDNIKADLDLKGGRNLWRAAGGFTSLVGSAGSSGSSTGSVLQTVLFIMESLVIIWALRHLLSGQAVRVKHAYYRAMTPLVPFLLVLLVIIIQLLPLTLGGVLLSAITGSVFGNNGFADVISLIVFLLLAGWSIYMVSASIFAAYIVTLPDMEPRQALRSAKDLVRFRRLVVIRKVLFMPILITIVMGLIIVPLIILLPAVVPAVFYVLSMLAILFVHTYLYSLYRELLE